MEGLGSSCLVFAFTGGVCVCACVRAYVCVCCNITVCFSVCVCTHFICMSVCESPDGCVCVLICTSVRESLQLCVAAAMPPLTTLPWSGS